MKRKTHRQHVDKYANVPRDVTLFEQRSYLPDSPPLTTCETSFATPIKRTFFFGRPILGTEDLVESISKLDPAHLRVPTYAGMLSIPSLSPRSELRKTEEEAAAILTEIQEVVEESRAKVTIETGTTFTSQLDLPHPFWITAVSYRRPFEIATAELQNEQEYLRKVLSVDNDNRPNFFRTSVALTPDFTAETEILARHYGLEQASLTLGPLAVIEVLPKPVSK